MPSVIVSNLSDATYRALKQRAAGNGRSTEAEIRLILEAAVAPELGLGATLAAMGQSLGGVELDLPRDKQAVEPARFA